jgi:hypothetical protein
MMKKMAEMNLRKMGMRSMKERVIWQCLSNGERNTLGRGNGEPHRVLNFDFPFVTTIYSD